VRRRTLAIAVIALLVVARRCGAAARRRRRFLVEADPLAHADAIVVLAGSYPDHILEAVALYREAGRRASFCREAENAGFRKLQSLGVTVPRVFELNRSVAEQLGVPSDAITVLERPAGSTYSEAEVVLDYVLQRGYRSLLLVTSKYHSARAARIYRFLAADRVAIIARPAREDDFQPSGWWRDRPSTRRVVIEYQKLLTFLLLDRWVLPPVSAGSTATPTPA
jgi:uncharacterized SAM-binding protein YcdF (DUF218 family)